MMANAVTAYRDNAASDRNVDASIAAVLAYLESSAPQPLPPLALPRRTGSQNLPPVRNLLPQPEEITHHDTSASVARNNVSNRKVSSIAQLVEGTLSNDKASKTADKPLKRGPKGPRKYSAPRPLGPLKPIAPKVALDEKEDPLAKRDASPKGKLKKSAAKKSGKRVATKGDKGEPRSAKGAPVESTEDMNTITSMNGGSELDLPHFNIPDYTMSASLLGSGGTSVDPNASGFPDNSVPFRDLHHSHFTSLHSSPHGHPENSTHQSLLAGLDYTPETSFSPISDPAPGQFIYHSPAFPPAPSGHVTPHSNISPLHSIHNSPQAYRATLESVQPVQSPIQQIPLASSLQMFSNRPGNGPSSLTELLAIEGGFQPHPHYTPSNAGPLQDILQETVGKRKRGNDQSSEQPNGKRRTIKPRTAVTAIQSVLNPASDARAEKNGSASPATSTNRPKARSPKKKRLPLPINITATKDTQGPRDSGSITPHLILPEASDHSSTQQRQGFNLQTSNSLSMVLNSEAGSALASPQLYEFASLNTPNDGNNGLLNNSSQRDLDGRLRVQSLLSLPSMSSQNNLNNSPSMQVMQIQPNLLGGPQLEDFNLMDQGRTDRTQNEVNNDPFNLRMMDTQSQFGPGLADVDANVINHSSTWDMLLQPSTNATFPAEMSNSNDQLYEQNQVPQVDHRPPPGPPPGRFTESQTTNDLLNETLSSESQGQFVDESKALTNSVSTGEKRRKRRGKHSRYVAAEGKNGEPDKTHIDVLVKTIQKTEQSQASETGVSAESQYDANLPSSVDVSLLRNSLPSIETLQLDSGANPGQTAQDRSLLDGMAGIPSTGEPSSNNVSFNMMDFLPENIEWNDILLPSSNGQVPLSRYPANQWNSTEYQDSDPADQPPNNSILIPPPQKLPPAKRGRKSKEERKRQETEKDNEAQANLPKQKAALYHCQYPGCASRFSQFQHFKTHVDSHEGIKPFRCDFEGCQKNFSQKGNLKAHQRKHTGEKPFVCDECDKAFAQKGNLQTHKMVHTGAKPYVCLIDNCTARYSQRGNLKMHQNKFHTETIQRLTTKAEACSKGGASLTEDEQKLADHLKILYKFANKGIKGRGKKEDPKPQPPIQTQPQSLVAEQQIPERPLDYAETLLPPPAGVRDGGASFMGLATAGWTRERMDDVFVGSQGHSQAQSNNYLGIPGDGGSGGLGGYAFGSLG